jgi:type II secretory pathway component PulF
MPDAQRFLYRALDAEGRKVSGEVAAADLAAAFDTLKLRGLSPVKLKRQSGEATRSGGHRLSDREVSAFIADLATLLRAGADMRTALGVAIPKAGRPGLAAMGKQLSTTISGGEALHVAFAKGLPARLSFIAALVNAGETSGDLAGALERGAEMIDSRLQARDQLVSVLSYPIFVLISAIAALLVILLLVVPSLSPLANSSQSGPGGVLAILIFASELLRENLQLIAVALAILVAAAIGAGLLGLWGPLIDRAIMRGPFRKLASAMAYGAFAIALGGILAAGAPMSEALRLAIRTTRSGVARRSLEPVLKAVRQGESLSSALGAVRTFPQSISRLASIGEQSGALGPMLVRAGRYEEKAALRAIESSARILGPVLIAVLGGMIGLLMAGLLSGISGLGDVALGGE